MDPTRRLEQRLKQIAYGKNTEEYQRYLAAVPKENRTYSDPVTPDPHADVSKRQFDNIIRAWRRALHTDTPDSGIVPQAPKDLEQAGIQAIMIASNNVTNIPGIVQAINSASKLTPVTVKVILDRLSHLYEPQRKPAQLSRS